MKMSKLPMRPVRLLTNGGIEVAQVEIPPFPEPPELLMWDNRAFLLKTDAGDVWQYREAIHYVCPKPIPGPETDTPF
jgi:hypothetical protein